jgi:tRNA-2-methylthio-N6-dimethylallyladenosine synthase
MLKEAGVCISTDIIVGYPTETEEDFLQTVSLCDAAQFVSAYCFKFSPRAGTPASLLDTLDDKEVEKRLDILLNKIKQNSKEAYARQLGTTQSVLMETPFNGRTLNNFWVRTTKKHTAGEIIELRITEAKDTILLA